MTQANNPESSEDQNEDSNQLSDVAEPLSKAEFESSQDESLKLELEKLKKELSATHDKYLRSLADFENFKRRAQKERSELLKYQGEQIILDLVRVIDDFDLAMQFANGQDQGSDPAKFKAGIELIYKGFCEVLNKWEIRAESSVGKAFDPVKHLAISRIFDPSSSPGTVVSELKKAFFYKDKMIRVGEVVVAAEPVD